MKKTLITTLLLFFVGSSLFSQTKVVDFNKLLTKKTINYIYDGETYFTESTFSADNKEDRIAFRAWLNDAITKVLNDNLVEGYSIRFTRPQDSIGGKLVSIIHPTLGFIDLKLRGQILNNGQCMIIANFKLLKIEQ